MEILVWAGDHAFEILGFALGLSSLWYTASSFRSEAKTRRQANLLAITANHREVWKVYLSNKDLGRVLDAAADTSSQPVTAAEKMFISFVIAHIGSVYYATHDQLVVSLTGLRRDIAQFLSLPIPRQVWEKIKPTQNEDFIAFVESCRNWK